jgi:predicted secreted protein
MNGSRGSIRTSYSACAVDGREYSGGLVASNNRGSVESSCFWDTTVSGYLSSDGGIGLTTVEMMNPEIVGLNGLANEPNWVLDPGKDYPRLHWQGTAGDVIAQPVIDWMDGDGSPEMPYQISDVDQFVRLSKAGALTDRHFILANDLELRGRLWYQAVFPSFSGTFNGNGFCIRHLTIQGRNHLGLIGNLRGGAVTNLGLEDIFIEGRGANIGGLLGFNDGGSVDNCHSTGDVAGSESVGGLAGVNLSRDGGITASHSTATVSGDEEIGGLVGSNWSGTGIIAGYAAGTVTGNERVGGLVGYNGSHGSIAASYCGGMVSGDELVGGLVGYNYRGSITTSHNASPVSGGWHVGGLVGLNREGIITESFDTGTVSGDTEVGGLVGENRDGSVINCYSAGTVKGSVEYVGGLVAWNGGNVVNCYSTGLVAGSEAVGGLVGHTQNGSVMSSFWDTETSSLADSDGGLAKSTIEMQTGKTFLNTGWDFVDEIENGADDVWKVAEGLDYPRLWWEEYDGQVTVEVGQRFAVTLESNPSTGYRWEWVDRQESILEQIGAAEFQPRETGDPPLVGAGGWDIFTFEATSSGQMALKLVYRRPWEEGMEPLKTFSLQVTVP